ncbi:MAG: patatin-like phospholipase family protein, partial [Planctomycetales bacterium]|nr:patatin-like phospholipase family protein [Planctomycetales bacterium]
EPVAEVGETTATAAELEPHDVGRVRRRGGELSAECDHLVLDLGLWRDDGALGVVLGDYEQIWVVVEACRWDETRRRLDDLLGRFPKLAPMTHLVWVLRDDERFAPAVEFPAGIVARDFKVVISEDSRRGSIYQRQGLTRLLRYIYGKRVGLALSGGGARGLAHLGALRVLDREGVFFDSIAGTSAGALMGLAYSGGWEPDDALAKFQRDLTPSWLFRRVPAGKRWYMLMKYRTGAWDRMLRTYAPEVRLEQLRIPLSTVAVDLVSGKQVVRDRGDAIHAVLESLNLPMISRPIVRDGMALVDGGVLNNLPANLLPERGARLVVGVDISRGLSPAFGGIGPGAERRRRGPGPMETIMRLTDVLAHEVTDLQSHAVDLMIGIDTSAFDFADFTNGNSLADVGEQATLKVLAQLKEMFRQQQVP